MRLGNDVKTVGVLSEMTAQRLFIERDWDVFTPITVHSRADFVAVHKLNGMVRKVQVKTVQTNTVKGVKYRQCRVMPHDIHYQEHEVDLFVFVYPPTGETWLAGAEDVIKQKSINFGRADGKGRPPKNLYLFTRIEI